MVSIYVKISPAVLLVLQSQIIQFVSLKGNNSSCEDVLFWGGREFNPVSVRLAIALTCLVRPYFFIQIQCLRPLELLQKAESQASFRRDSSVTLQKGKIINFISRVPVGEICVHTQGTGVSVGERNEIICPGRYKRSEKKKMQCYLLVVMSMNHRQTPQGNIHKSEPLPG